MARCANFRRADERHAMADLHQHHHEGTHVHSDHAEDPTDVGTDFGIDIGIAESDRAKIADGLSRLLGDTYTLYLKTHNYHWNVTGPMFQSLHLMFETQYTELALAVDQIAERIRALGVRAPASYREFAALSSVSEDSDEPDATEMIRRLVQGQETVVRTARSIFPIIEQAHDEPTADLLTQRMQIHEKTAWMLRSLLET
jgi:starvation-inducible DNA-binding protein